MSIALRIAVAPIALIAAFCQPAAAQISMQRPGLTGVPAGRKLAAPTRTEAAWTPEDGKRLAQILKRMTPKERKKLAKTVKRMTPAQRLQLLAAIKQQMAGKGPPSQSAKRPR